MPTPIRVLYLEGDAAAPKYLRNVLGTDEFDLLEGTQAIGEDPEIDVCILSDLPLTRLGRHHEEWLVERVVHGAGLLLVGGWSSYGRGLYAGSRLVEHFPVRVETGDDRQNLSSGAVLLPTADHPLIDGFQFDPPPVVAGYNRVHPRRGAKVLLEGRRIVAYENNTLRLAQEGDPVLVVSEMTGRAVALATDLAPHWSGGLTDWGDEMVRFADGTEMGTDYVEFVRRLAAWCAKRDIEVASPITSR